MQGKNRNSSEAQQYYKLWGKLVEEKHKWLWSFPNCPGTFEVQAKGAMNRDMVLEAGSLLSMRLKWCTFQPYKVQLPTRKLPLWQVHTVRMKAILFYSTNMTWCFIYHIKVIPVANFPWLSPSSSKSCTLPCYKVTAAVMTNPLHSTLTSTRKPIYCWWAGCQDSSSPQGITRVT